MIEFFWFPELATIILISTNMLWFPDCDDNCGLCDWLWFSPDLDRHV